MADDSIDLSILFADVCGSTRLYERLGDQRGQAVIDACIAYMTEAVEAHGGRVLKVIGDEIMASFDAPRGAVGAACDIQEGNAAGRTFAGQALTLRAATHHGAVRRAGAELFGPAVDVAARLAGLARGGQVIASETTWQGLAEEVRSRAREIERVALAAAEPELRVFEITWEPEDVTALGVSVAPPRGLVLRYGDREIELPARDRTTVTVGRSPQADLVVDNKLASRLHCRFEYRLGQFFLVDQSTNGTHVRTADGTAVHLQGEELAIWGQGMVGLGERIDAAPDDLLRFSCA
ncbi:MAG: adenylate/guanylate cyclase domain-containing protein [Pseudomonadales bacterium]|jgi:class 3 adenylate cyclase|nr:adenylate/guanylate cyclase domain-containing protein [Pseudomonadales bacterium]